MRQPVNEPIEFYEQRRAFSRRRALKWVIRLGYGSFALAFALPALAVRSLSRRTEKIAEGDLLVATSGAAAGQPLNANDIAVGMGVQAYPEGKTEDNNNLVEIVRLAEGVGEDALVAYSAICTHLGCPVFANLDDKGHIACPCHNSQFDPAEEAEVVGGPAERPLPSLPIEVAEDGRITVAGDFSAEVGPN
jgi:ubiquinol-cytochrome c reductase iron-sulfur subunit